MDIQARFGPTPQITGNARHRILTFSDGGGYRAYS